MDNSFAALRDHRKRHYALRLTQAAFAEHLRPDDDGPGLSQTVVGEGHVIEDLSQERAVGAGVVRVGQALRIEFRCKAEDQVLQLDGKFPLGWLEMSDVSESLVVHVRPALMASIVATLPLLASNGLTLDVDVPDLEGDVPGFLPVLAYAYRAGGAEPGAR